jgi:hypothetical protein
MCWKTKHFCYCCAKDFGVYLNPKYCNKMKHCLTTIDGDSLCWEQTVTVLQYKYDCCSACEKRRCHYRALLKNAPTCQPKMEKFIKERKGRAH